MGDGVGTGVAAIPCVGSAVGMGAASSPAAAESSPAVRATQARQAQNACDSLSARLSFVSDGIHIMGFM